MKLNIKWVQDVIGDNYKNWKNGNTIFILAPTGSGKSFFIATYLHGYARQNNKKILWLSNRDKLKDQNNKIKEQIKDNNIITCMNYQQIENALLNNRKIPHYDYIVADEIHYIFSDALFNRKTELTINWLSEQTNCIKILESATGDLVKQYLKYKKIDIIEYKIEDNYDYIENLYFYNNNRVIKKMLSQLPEDEKAIYFTNIKEAYNTSKEFNNAEFICSKYQSKYSKYSNSEIIADENYLPTQILCATTVLDNGVNIKDIQVKHIIVDYLDLDTIQQCIGRRRIQNTDDKINVYIRNRNISSLNTTKHYANKGLEQARYLKKYGEYEFLKKYQRQDFQKTIYVTPEKEFKINEMSNVKYRYDLFVIEKMLKVDNGFIVEVNKRLKRDKNDINILDKIIDAITLNDYLDKLIGIKLFKEEQKSFKQFILKELLDAPIPPKGNHGSIGLKTVNALLDDYKLNYIVNSKREKRGIDRDKTYWIISKL